MFEVYMQLIKKYVYMIITFNKYVSPNILLGKWDV
jgi:hypothetical protein